jgi:transketolase
MTTIVEATRLTAFLTEKSREIRRQVLTMIYRARSGHPGSSLSAVEIMTVLLYHEIRHDPQNPEWPNRDRFILSKGHAAPVLYAILADQGYFQSDDLDSFRTIGCHLQGHPSHKSTPGVEATTGSLGQGLSIGCGLAYAIKYLNRSDNRVYVLLGDGELDEGQIWEAAMFASHYNLDNLIALVDRNNFQYVGKTESVMALEPLADKWCAFGWHVEEVDNGNDVGALLIALENCKEVLKPKLILAKTIKGKGVSFMENTSFWHGKAPNKDEFERAMAELEGIE